MTRLEVFKRDGYVCQYCGKEMSNLTIDHVIPRFQKGQHTWENVVTACAACNRRKAGRTPQEAGMVLKKNPFRPKVTDLFFIPARYREIREEWLKYMPGESGGGWK